ncbi:MAG: hypothetical protein IT342_24230 [Candidatus Melainabacteria bacterium]|nr:hypothetical protein [Candidatus Melainabacteria bacterium]
MADRGKFTLTLIVLTLAFVAAQKAFASRPFNEVKVAPRLSTGEAAAVRIQPKREIQAQVFSSKGLKDIEGLVLKQEYRFIGKCTTYFSPLGISVESNSLSILFNAKTQNLCLYSDDTKKYYACDAQTWKKKSKVMFQNPTSHPRLTAWKFLRNEKVCGMNARVFRRFSYMDTLTNEDTIWVTHDVDLTSDARSLLYALLKVTDTVPEGVPLRHALASRHKAVVEKKADFLGRHRVTKSKDSDHVDYQTFSIQKVKIPVSKYIMPSGYKRAESEMEVFFNTEDSMSDLEMPDLGSEKSKKKMVQ